MLNMILNQRTLLDIIEAAKRDKACKRQSLGAAYDMLTESCMNLLEEQERLETRHPEASQVVVVEVVKLEKKRSIIEKLKGLFK